MAEKIEKSFWLRTRGFIAIIAIIVVIYIILGIVTYMNLYIGDTSNHTSAGQFGDMFGWITSLFSSLSFAALIYTIIMQRTELNNTIIEMREQNKINEEQLKTNLQIQQTQNLQRINAVFYRMIARLELARNQIGSSVSLDASANFQSTLNEVNKFFYELGNKNPIKYEKSNHKYISQKYKNGDQRSLNTEKYYKELDIILELLFFSNLPLDTIKFYIKILKTYLDTQAEIVLVYYHLGFRYDLENPIRRQIVEAGLFEGINKTLFPWDDKLSYNNVFFAPIEKLTDEDINNLVAL